jgi:hypothetical protein
MQMRLFDLQRRSEEYTLIFSRTCRNQMVQPVFQSVDSFVQTRTISVKNIR